MRGSVAPTLDYERPATSAPGISWSAVFVRVGWFAAGFAPSVGLLLATQGDFRGDHALLLIGVFLLTGVGVAVLFFTLPFLGSDETSQFGRHRRLAFIVGATLFPAFHGAMCALVGLVKRDSIYAAHVLPYQFVLPWIALIALVIAASRRSDGLGRRAAHWIIAGGATPIVAFATARGVPALEMSAAGSVTAPTDAGQLIAAVLALAPYFVIALAFERLPIARLRIARPVTSTDLEVPPAEHIE